MAHNGCAFRSTGPTHQFGGAAITRIAIKAVPGPTWCWRPGRRATGEVIQFPAGAPELQAWYRNAPPAARALIHAAMAARSLGTGIGLPRVFLEASAPGYLTDAEWDGLRGDGLEKALAYTADPCKGAHGPLARIRPARPGTLPAAAGAGSRASKTTAILPACCAVCPPSSADSGRNAALKHLRSRLT
jgi:hypothetical protein